MITVEKKVPLPGASPTAPKYPWKKMAVNDSFLAPTDVSEASFRAHASNAARRHGIRVTVRRTSEGLRVWRIA